MAIQPMLASLTEAPLDDPHFVYEPKYDGIRAVAEIGRDSVRLWSRLGNDKAPQFPEIASALQRWASKRKAPVVLDGEIVALDANGDPTGFQALQGRIHLADPSRPSGPSRLSRPSGPPGSFVATAFIAFDVLKEGDRDLRERPLTERRTALERIFSQTGDPILRLSRQVRGDGSALYDEAFKQGWEGLIAKHAASLYKPGKRTPDWRKVKIVHEQEFVIGGWTEPRQTRSYFGALLLGVYPSNQQRAASNPPSLDGSKRASAGKRCLAYVGHTGTGFDEKELARLMKLLKPIETGDSPFCEKIKTNERAHWTRPDLVAQIRFTEWTADAKLRHPVYLGLRDDKKPANVTREDVRIRGSGPAAPKPAQRAKAGSRPAAPKPEQRAKAGGTLIDQLTELEKARRDGVITLPDGDSLKVTNLGKVFWPKLKLTKGDLFRYYARVAPCLLPVLDDRPLVMKRFPNGIDAQPFYQHRAPDYPPGIRVETVATSAGDRGPRMNDATRQQIIGGTLKALIYTTQLAAISQDPWFSRVQHPQFADHAAFDLDPSDGVPFERVLDVARWIRDELDMLGAKGWAKTSGSEGLHIYVPLPPATPYDAGMIFCQIVATVVAQKYPKAATVERAVAARGKRVYIDFLQNILGKTLASAYSARASTHAGVSTPLSWAEVDRGVNPREFTITTVPSRLDSVGDLWKGLLTAKGFDLERVSRYVKTSKR